MHRKRCVRSVDVCFACRIRVDGYGEIVHWEDIMTKAPKNYRGVAKVFRSGCSQAVRPPAVCRFETSEVEAIEEGDCVTLRHSTASGGSSIRRHRSQRLTEIWRQ